MTCSSHRSEAVAEITRVTREPKCFSLAREAHVPSVTAGFPRDNPFWCKDMRRRYAITSTTSNPCSCRRTINRSCHSSGAGDSGKKSRWRRWSVSDSAFMRKLGNVTAPSEEPDVTSAVVVSEDCSEKSVLKVKRSSIPLYLEGVFLSKRIECCEGSDQSIVAASPKTGIERETMPSAPLFRLIPRLNDAIRHVISKKEIFHHGVFIGIGKCAYPDLQYIGIGIHHG